jgi:hypothetical protein
MSSISYSEWEHTAPISYSATDEMLLSTTIKRSELPIYEYREYESSTRFFRDGLRPDYRERRFFVAAKPEVFRLFQFMVSDFEKTKLLEAENKIYRAERHVRSLQNRINVYNLLPWYVKIWRIIRCISLSTT